MQQPGAAVELPAWRETPLSLALQAVVLAVRRVACEEHERRRIVLLELAGAVDLHLLASHIEHVRLPLHAVAGRLALEAALQAPQVLGHETPLIGRDLAADIEATGFVAARQRRVERL